jgi:predicted DNA-binding protein (MmcQ/YjbR family)
MNKNHWISIDLDGDVSDEVLKVMIDQSYQLIFSSLSKTLQNKIIGG